MNRLMKKYHEIQKYSGMIKYIRIILGCNQEELAVALGVAHRMVWRWEGGECKPPQEVSRKIEILSRNPEAIRPWLDVLKAGVIAPAAPKSPEPSVPTPSAIPETAAAVSKTHHLDAFIAERCVVGEQYTVRYAALWVSYLRWCAGNDVTLIAGRLEQQRFAKALKERGFLAMAGTSNVAMRVGIALLQPIVD